MFCGTNNIMQNIILYFPHLVFYENYIKYCQSQEGTGHCNNGKECTQGWYRSQSLWMTTDDLKCACIYERL